MNFLEGKKVEIPGRKQKSRSKSKKTEFGQKKVSVTGRGWKKWEKWDLRTFPVRIRSP